MTASSILIRNSRAFILSVLLVACSPDQAETAGDAATQATSADSSDTTASTAGTVEPLPAPQASPSLVPPAGLAVPDVTVNSLMKDSIDPAARQLWNAVSYIVSEAGVVETSPETDEDWNLLRESADLLVQAALTLQLPGLRIHADPNAERPDFQYPPQEIAAAVAANPVPWRSYAQQMQTTTLQILRTIERRDLTEYTTMGVTLNESCEGCHAEYWYRPLPMRGAEGIR